MKHGATTLVSVLALAMFTACGGGGQEPTGTQVVAAASESPTVERVVTIVGRERAATTAFTAADTNAAAGSLPYLDPLIVQRVHAELDRIESALHQLDDSQIEKREALEVVSDARAELRRDRPNKLKLRSLLSGLVQGSQRLNVKGAGDFLPGLVLLV